MNNLLKVTTVAAALAAGDAFSILSAIGAFFS